MPSKKKKYNARFPAGRIKKIMQSDEEVGKVAQAVPIIISKTLELFVESLLEKTLRITNSRNARTLSPSHMKQCIMAESRFDFLRELVKNIPDISVAEEIAHDSSPTTPSVESPIDLSLPSTSCGISIQTESTNGSTTSNGTIPSHLNKDLEKRRKQSEDLKRKWEDHKEKVCFNPVSSKLTIHLDPEVVRRLNAENKKRQNSSESQIPFYTDMSEPSSSSSTPTNDLSVFNKYLGPIRERGDLKQSPVCEDNNYLRAMSGKLNPNVDLDAVKRLFTENNQKKSNPETLGISANFYKENSVIQHTSDASEPTSSSSTSATIPSSSSVAPVIPTKIQRMDSAPPVSSYSSLAKNSIRKLQHQSKSIPCTSKEQPKTPVTPAPIVNIDICNRPIVKIDYSNLALATDKETTEEEDDDDPTTETEINPLASVANKFSSDPVINIDLSKIVTLPQPTARLPDNTVIPVAGSSKQMTSIISSKSSSTTLELDEDYDNI